MVLLHRCFLSHSLLKRLFFVFGILVVLFFVSLQTIILQSVLLNKNFKIEPAKPYYDLSKASPLETFLELINKVYIYSAVAYNVTSDDYYSAIYLNTWFRNDITIYGELKCCLLYKDVPLPVMEEVAQKKDWQMMGHGRLDAKQFVCPNPLTSLKKVPEAVTLTNKFTCPENMTSYASVVTPTRPEGTSFGVCAKIAYGNLSAESIVEWFEYQRHMGVSKVMAYTYKLNEAAMKVMDYYSSIGFAEILPFSLPLRELSTREVGIKNYQGWNDEQLVVFDCQMRLAGYSFLGVYDFDEYILPKRANNLLEMLVGFTKDFPGAAGFLFATEVYVTSWGEREGKEHDLIISKYIQRTGHILDRAKSIAIPSKVHPGRISTHGFLKLENYQKLIVEPYRAILKHYRTCRPEWLKKDGYKCYKKIRRIKDDSMLPIADIIRDNVYKVINAVSGG